MIVRPLTPALGAEVADVDLCEVDETTFAEIRRLWLAHLVLVLPGQHLSPAEHVAFAERFGHPHVHEFLAHLDAEHPEVLVLEGDRPVAENWHTDVSYEARPPAASILRMVTAPANGGDTLWSNQHRVYDALSQPMRQVLEGLNALHMTHDRDRSAVHPVVAVHPDTGRRSVFVNRHFTTAIVELPTRESDTLLRFLFDLSEEPRFQCRHQWSEGDVALWDNRCTMHRVVDDYDEFRRVERVSVL